MTQVWLGSWVLSLVLVLAAVLLARRAVSLAHADLSKCPACEECEPCDPPSDPCPPCTSDPLCTGTAPTTAAIAGALHIASSQTLGVYPSIVFPASLFTSIDTNDFTIEFMIKTSAGGGQYATPFMLGTSQSAYALSLQLKPRALVVFLGGAWSNNIEVVVPCAATDVTSTEAWNHIVFERSGGYLRVSFNGAIVLTTEQFSFDFFTSSRPFAWGGQVNASNFGVTHFAGWLSNVRITRGAVYGGLAPTVPTTPLGVLNTGSLVTLAACGISATDVVTLGADVVTVTDVTIDSV
jgi:hypothetical protein